MIINANFAKITLQAPQGLSMRVDRPGVRAVVPVEQSLAQCLLARRAVRFRPDEARRARARARAHERGAAAAAHARRIAYKVQQELEAEQAAEERERVQRRLGGQAVFDIGDFGGDWLERPRRWLGAPSRGLPAPPSARNVEPPRAARRAAPRRGAAATLGPCYGRRLTMPWRQPRRGYRRSPG